ncbi:MAG: tetratricopeptide repeat protein [Bacteroidetes bacterium]|nr:tetratricopeptide repeat protein [Bacteroidota bacterium]
MQKKQIILIGSAILLIGLLFLLGNRKGDESKSKSAGEGNVPMAQGGMDNHETEVLDFDKYMLDSEAALSTDVSAQLKKLKALAEANNSAIQNKDLAEFWEKHENLNMAAHFYKKAAFLENTEKSVTFAGNLFVALMQKSEDASIRRWQAKEAITCFNKALELNPENVETKIALATCYTEGTGETMKGVTLLREITQKDSNNISANIILGKLAIQSGQLDKAIKRLELVLTIKPDNTEAMYFLAEAYKSQGNKEKAISLFEKCKKLVNNPDFTKEIDNYINSFK